MKYCRPSITPITTANRITGEIAGSVTCRNRCSVPAPSISAASYSWRGTSSTAARKITITLPTAHIASRTSDGFAHSGDWNQFGPLMPNTPRPLLTGPVAGLSR